MTARNHGYTQREVAKRESLAFFDYQFWLTLINAQVLREIESKAAFSAQQLQIVRGQISSKTREKRMLELSSKELDGLPNDTPVYDGVGKM